METTPIPPYLLLQKPAQNVDRLRKRLIAAKWREMKNPSRKLGFLAVVLGWPAIAGWMTWKATRKYGQKAWECSGISRWRQLFDSYGLAVWYEIAPRAYYMYGLFDIDRRSTARQYLHNQELFAICSALNQGKYLLPLRNKIRFDELCQKHDPPHVPILAAFVQQKVVYGHVLTPEQIPLQDLFIKPVEGPSGKGASLWKILANNHVERNDGEVLSLSQFFISIGSLASNAATFFSLVSGIIR